MKTRRITIGYYETRPGYMGILKDVYYVKGKHEERIAADVADKEVLDIMLNHSNRQEER